MDTETEAALDDMLRRDLEEALDLEAHHQAQVDTLEADQHTANGFDELDLVVRDLEHARTKLARVQGRVAELRLVLEVGR